MRWRICAGMIFFVKQFYEHFLWDKFTSFERKGLKRFQDLCLKTMARIWTWLSYMCHIRSEAKWCTQYSATLSSKVKLPHAIMFLGQTWRKFGRATLRYPRQRNADVMQFWSRESIWDSIQEQLLRSNDKQFRGGLVFQARRLVVSLNSRPRVITKKAEVWCNCGHVTLRYPRQQNPRTQPSRRFRRF